MKKKMRVIIPLIALVMLALALPSPTVADVPDAIYFSGPVTVNGADVPNGTVVTAWLENPSVGPWTTTTQTFHGASWYGIYIPADNPSTLMKDGAVAGDQVHFSVSSTPVPGTATWERYGPSGLMSVPYPLYITYVPLTGDVNGDGHVNGQDLLFVAQHFGETGVPGWIPEDVNKDGVIDMLDMILIIQNWTG